MAPEYPEFVQEQVNTTQGFTRHNNDSYSTPYNSGWGDHPKLSWTQQAPPTNPHSYCPEFENKVLQALQRLEASTRLLNSHTPSINKLETHMSQLGDTINTSEEGNFSSQPVSNFMDEYGLGSSQEKNIYHEEVNETMTLMNEMVGETKSVDDNGDMGELMTNPMGLEIEVVIEEQETSMHTSFPIEEESILHEEVVGLSNPISSPPTLNCIRLEGIDFISVSHCTLNENPNLVDLVNCMKTNLLWVAHLVEFKFRKQLKQLTYSKYLILWHDRVQFLKEKLRWVDVLCVSFNTHSFPYELNDVWLKTLNFALLGRKPKFCASLKEITDDATPYHIFNVMSWNLSLKDHRFLGF